jgi:electron transfer flavoprotein beta subunit
LRKGEVMNVIVCIKRVPDTETKVRVGSDGRHIDPSGVSYIMNPYDEYALEEGLQLVEEAGEGKVTVVSLGDAGCKETLRTALAMGAHEAVHVQSASADLDAHATALALAEVLRGIPYDIVLFGKQAVDNDQSQVGLLVSEALGLPAASVIVDLKLEGSEIEVRREIEGGYERVRLPLPAVVTAQKGLNEPRYASLKGIMAAKKKPIRDIEAPAGEPLVEVLEMSYPPERPAGRIIGEGVEAVPELVRVLKEEAKLL